MRIAFARSGSGPALLLIHPLGTDRHVWDPVIGGLSAHRTVIAIDLPGFGDSPPLTGVTPTPRALAAATAQLIDRLELGRPHVAGDSLGGWVALELGLRGAVASVTAIAPAGLWSGPLAPRTGRGHRLARVLGPLAQTVVSTAAGRDALLRGSVAHPRRMGARDARRLVRAYGRAPGFVAADDAMRAATFGGLGDIRCPVTLVWPEHDRLVARPRSLPASVRSLTLPDAGHIPTWDAPEAVTALLLEGSRDA